MVYCTEVAPLLWHQGKGTARLEAPGEPALHVLRDVFADDLPPARPG